MHFKARGAWAWGIDQVALYSTLAYVNMTGAKTGEMSWIYYQGPADASNGEAPGAIFYFPTGIKKYFAADPGRGG